MSAVDVNATIDVTAPLDQVRAAIADFHRWPAWSPWLYIDRDARIDYRGEPGTAGHAYEWSGDKVGSGSMTMTTAGERRIDCDLQFLKPFKSKAKVEFELDETDDRTIRVTWRMQSHLPFFLFWMAGNLRGMVGADYRRGLAMLKDLVERGEVRSTTVVSGPVDVEQAFFVGTEATSPMNSLSDSMANSFALTFAATGEAATGSAFTIYRKIDFRREACTYVAALPTAAITTVDAPAFSALRPACDALKAIHTGPYRHLSNAWALLMAEAKQRKLKAARNAPPFERYLNDPATTTEEHLITELNFPVRV